MAKHQKHPPLLRPRGQYHHNEWTLIGAPCEVISAVVEKLSAGLSALGLSCGYMDMSHQASVADQSVDTIYTDQQRSFSLHSNRPLKDKGYRKYFSDLAVLFVNGNHYSGDRQVVFLHPEKRDSLHRKVDRLTDVKVLISSEAEVAPYDFLEAYLTPEVQRFTMSAVSQISEYISSVTKAEIAPIKGLVLAGGKSTRMGEDKATLRYHQKDQQEYEADLLAPHCAAVYFSVSKLAGAKTNYPQLVDSFIGLGPFGGILSAFRSDPNAAWLTLACDLPYVDASTIEQLVEHRDASKFATCFYNPETAFPEPLITIWEPRAYPILLDYLSQGNACPRKVLINSEVKLIDLKETIRIKNANTPEERQAAQDFLAGH